MSDEITVRILTNDERKIWDEFNTSSPNGGFYTSTPWLELMEKHTPPIDIFGAFNKNNDLIAGITLKKETHWVLNMLNINSYVPPPPTYYSGIVLRGGRSTKESKQESEMRKIISAFVDFFKGNNQVTITHSPLTKDVRGFIWSGWDSKIGYTYWIDLTRDEDVIFNDFDRNIKRRIKKCINDGIEVVESTDAMIFWTLLRKTFERQDLKIPVSQGFIEDAVELSKKYEFIKFLVAKESTGEVSSGTLITSDNKTGYHVMAASDPDFRASQSNTFLTWEAMKYIKSQGKEIFDFMGANTPHIVDFKKQFNPILTPYYIVEKNTPLVLFLRKWGKRTRKLRGVG